MSQDYLKRLEEENEKLRSTIFTLFSQKGRRSIYGSEYNTEGTDCHHVGMAGNCNLDCPVFKNAECEAPDGNLEWIEEQIEAYKELLEMYEIKQKMDREKMKAKNAK